MNVNDARRILRKSIEPLIRPHGFKKKGISFQRIYPDRVDEISVGVHKDQLGRIRFTFGVGICFRSVETLLNPDLDELEMSMTVGVPIHFLHSDRKYFDWEINESTDLAELTNSIDGEIKNYALAFFSKYSDLESVRLSLKSDDPKDWFVLTPEQRLIKLVAIEYVQGKPDVAVSMLDHALSRLDSVLPKYRIPLEKLRNSMAKGN